MTEFIEKYVNPFTDYGFKKLFGEEPNKDLLLDFLNELLKDEQGQITEITYLKSDQLETRFDKWLYVIRNLNKLDRIPDRLRETIFTKLFETAEIAKFTPDQVRSYEDSLKYYRDIKASMDTKFEEGMMQGKKEGKLEVAKALLEGGISMDVIVKTTGLSEDEIKKGVQG